MALPPIVTTSFLLGNLHCPSCVSSIKSLFSDNYGDQVSWVSPNLVTSVVTIEHLDSAKVSVRNMEATLEEGGFEVCGFSTTGVESDDSRMSGLQDAGESSAAGIHAAQRSQSALVSGWSRLWRAAASASTTHVAETTHLQNCEQCRSSNALGGSFGDDKKISHLHVAPLDSKEDRKTWQQPHPTGDEEPAIWRATVSIGGMTCASCANTITEEIQKLPGVSQVVVNLVGNSGAITYTGREISAEIVEGIEDLGYDALLDKVVQVKENTGPPSDLREVQVMIDGMFCPRCPERISSTLASVGSEKLIIIEEPTIARPVLRLSYRPGAPAFTIRHILRAISAADPSLRPSIHHPPTLEEKSRAIRAKHQRQLLWREMLTFVVAIPTFILGIVYMSLVPHHDPIKRYLMHPWTSGLSRLDIALFILATPVYFFAADVFHVRAIKEIRTMWRSNSRTPLLARFYKFGSMDMLMSLGTSIAYISSIAQMIAAAARNEDKVPEGLFYFDSVVFLTLFLLAGRLIEAYSKSKTGNAVELLVKLRPDTAIIVEKDKADGQHTSTIPLDQLECGDIVKVPQGASPPADGVILSGDSTFDESSLTGESRPVTKREGDEVFSGTLNQSSVVTVRVTSLAGKSMLDQIVEVVREGQTKRAPMEQIADTLTSYFVPAITLFALITWAVWMGVGLSIAAPDEVLDTPGGSVAFALQFAIAVFVVACPCGLALAAPTAIFVGGGLAAKHGILAKSGGEAFEKAQKVDCVVFDKTGTLTMGGEPQVTDSIIYPDGDLDGIEERTLLSVAKLIEESSSHPIAKAIVAFCGPQTPSVDVLRAEELPGKGMTASYEREHVSFDMAIGNEPLMGDLSVAIPPQVGSTLQTWKTEAKSVALVAIKTSGEDAWSLAAAFAVSDRIRPEAAAVIRTLESSGIQVWMLSGDNATTAQAVAQRVGIPSSNVLAEVLPSEKAAKITYLQSTLRASAGRGREHATRRAMIAMIGDGINDSPALTTADVGVAIGSGSDVAISSADFVLASSHLTAVPTLLELSRAVVRRVRLNFAWALVYNMCAVPVAAGCLYPVRTSGGGHVKLDPVWAALAMALSSISVVLSSLALRTSLPLLGFQPRNVAARLGEA